MTNMFAIKWQVKPKTFLHSPEKKDFTIEFGSKDYFSGKYAAQ